MLGRCDFCHGPLVSTRAVTHLGMPWLEFVKIQQAAPTMPTPVIFCDEACQRAGQFWLENRVNA